MKSVLLSFCLLLGGCAIQGEVFRLQERMRVWNELLPQEQRVLFAQNDTNTVGAFLDEQEASSPEFAQKLRDIRVNEAIMAFDGVQTVHFFYNTLLKDLAKFSYAELINSLTADEFNLFLDQVDGSGIANIAKVAGVLNYARSAYGMPDFSDADILMYHRQKSMPAHLYIVVYDTLTFAGRNSLLADVYNGSYQGIDETLKAMRQNVKSRRPQTRRVAKAGIDEWVYILSRAQVPAMADSDFMKIIVEKILPEMDEDVREKILTGIEQRFPTAQVN
ncbi:MAG: hypothetical protein ACRCY4_06900 [Brevinema sp.]